MKSLIKEIVAQNPYHKIIKRPIKFLGIAIGYYEEIKFETFAEGLERVENDLAD